LSVWAVSIIIGPMTLYIVLSGYNVLIGMVIQQGGYQIDKT